MISMSKKNTEKISMNFYYSNEQEKHRKISMNVHYLNE